MTIAYIGLGSNVGDRAGYLRSAVAKMALFSTVENRSPIYETAPIGFLDQGAFYNAVVRVRTTLSAVELLARLKSIEKELGRTPGPRYGPREIDLDILIMEGESRQEPPVLPHPEMHRRAFVLRPLLDLAPGIDIPGRGRAQELLAGLGDQGVRISAASLDAP